MKTTVISQPNYLPWLGYFEQIARSDLFVFLDTVQFARREWQNRNRLKNFDNKPFWLTVPVMKHTQKTPINKICISYHTKNWQANHLNSIKTYLGHSKYFSIIYPYIEAIINKNHSLVVDLNIELIKQICDILCLNTNFIRASSLQTKGKKTNLLIDICKKVGADHYYSSLGAKAYLKNDENLFYESGIELEYQLWEHPQYNQQGNSFVSHLSVLDALMNVGPDTTRNLIYK